MAWHGDGDGMEMARLTLEALGSNEEEGREKEKEKKKQEGGRRKEDQRVQRKAQPGPSGCLPNL